MFCSSCTSPLGSDVEKSAEQKAEEIKQKSFNLRRGQTSKL